MGIGSRTVSLAAVIAVMGMGVFVPSGGATATRPAAGASDASDCSTPALSFASTATLEVPIGSGSAIPPTLTVTCAGVAVADPDVTVALSADSSGVVWGDGLASDSEALQGSDAGVVSLPIVTSSTEVGSFTITASFDGATAMLAGSVAGSLSGVLPPENPSSALALDEDRVPDCSGPGDDSTTCIDESLALINAGRSNEGIGPVQLPSNWAQLTVDEQLLVMTDLERTARGLPPDTGLASDWDSGAQTGADADRDPTQTGGWSPQYEASAQAGGSSSSGSGFFSVEDPGMPNAIMAMVAWNYTDAVFPDGSSGDADCSASDPDDCWGHRDAELHDAVDSACELSCAVGAGYDSTGYDGSGPAYTEIWGIFDGNNADPLTFTWASEVSELPACEQSGDSCSWSGQPLMTSAGYENVPGVGPDGAPTQTTSTGSSTTTTSGSGSSSSPERPQLGVALSATARGRTVTVIVRFTRGHGTVSAVATAGRRSRALKRRSLGSGRYQLTVTLPPGRWTIVVRYLPAAGYRAHPATHLIATVG